MSGRLRSADLVASFAKAVVTSFRFAIMRVYFGLIEREDDHDLGHDRERAFDRQPLDVSFVPTLTLGKAVRFDLDAGKLSGST